MNILVQHRRFGLKSMSAEVLIAHVASFEGNKTPMPTENDQPTEESPQPVHCEVPLPTPMEERFSAGCLFWFFAWLGTVLAGGIFGILVAIFEGGADALSFAILGLIFGLFIAGVVAVPVHLHAAFFTWAFWLGRFRVAMAALAGGLTGFLATGGIGDFSKVLVGSIAAAILGATGSGLAAFFCHRRITFRHAKLISVNAVGEFTLPDERTAGGDKKSRQREKAPWQFTMRDLFVHFTAVAVLISFWTTLFAVRRSQPPQKPQPPVAQPKETVDERSTGD